MDNTFMVPDGPFEESAKMDLATYPEGLSRRMPSSREELLKRKSNLETKLSKVNNALKALDANPELENFMEAVKEGLR